MVITTPDRIVEQTPSERRRSFFISGSNLAESNLQTDALYGEPTAQSVNRTAKYIFTHLAGMVADRMIADGDLAADENISGIAIEYNETMNYGFELGGPLQGEDPSALVKKHKGIDAKEAWSDVKIQALLHGFLAGALARGTGRAIAAIEQIAEMDGEEAKKVIARWVPFLGQLRGVDTFAAVVNPIHSVNVDGTKKTVNVGILDHLLGEYGYTWNKQTGTYQSTGPTDSSSI